MNVKPITPQQVGAAKTKEFPPQVIEAFNSLIAKSFVNGEATVYQEDAVAAIAGRLDVDKSKIYDEGWLNVEEMYKDAGWDVRYDKPAYDENYRAHFVFSVK